MRIVVTIQTVPQRMGNAKKIQSEFKDLECHIVEDRNIRGVMHGFISCVSLHKDTEYDYRVHLQDDVILVKGFEDYIKKLALELQQKEIEVIHLYDGKKQYCQDAFKQGKKFIKARQFASMQAVMFSKEADNYLLSERINYEKKIVDQNLKVQGYSPFADDTYCMWVFGKKNKNIKSWFHLPALVQHNVNLKSTLGHRSNKTAMSYTFDINYLKNKSDE